MRVLFLAASPRRESQSRRLARHAFDYALRAHGDCEHDFMHLGEEPPPLFVGDYDDEAARPLVERVTGADALVVIAPVYNGSFPAAFKSLFEFVDYKSLAGKVVAIGITGGGPRGFMKVRSDVAALFDYFGMHVAPRGVYAERRQLAGGIDEDVRERAERVVDDVVALLAALAAERVREAEGPAAANRG